MSRIESSAKNLITALIGQIFGVAVSLAARVVFLRVLSAEYLGLNGLFTNILTIFSLVELGVGPAMNFSLYKPLAKGNIEQVKSLMALYRKAYIIIGSMIALIGLVGTPFYTIFMDEVPNIPNLTLIYWLFVANTAVSYFFSYKRALIICDEKRYIATIYRYAFYFALNIAQVLFLIVTRNYILFLVLQVLFTIAENVGVSHKAEKLYPYLKEKNIQPISKETAASIRKNIGAMLFHKIGTMFVMSTDNLILSKYVGLLAVGLYSNYYLIIDGLNRIIGQVFSSIVASVGNLNASDMSDGHKKLELVFERVFFLNFWIYGFCCCCLWVLFNPFITLWLGEHLVFDEFTVFILVANFYLTGMRKTCATFREATGAFYYDRYKPLVESFINIVVSIFLARKLGVAGVFLGTIISTLTTCIWVEPYILYKHVFCSSARKYALQYVFYTIITVAVCAATNIIAHFLIMRNTFTSLVIRMVLCLLIPNLVFIICFYHSDNFKFFWEMIRKMSKNILGFVKK